MSTIVLIWNDSLIKTKGSLATPFDQTHLDDTFEKIKFASYSLGLCDLQAYTWLKVFASMCAWLRVFASMCVWLKVIASMYAWLKVFASMCTWLKVFANMCAWLRVLASYSLGTVYLQAIRLAQCICKLFAWHRVYASYSLDKGYLHAIRLAQGICKLFAWQKVFASYFYKETATCWLGQDRTKVIRPNKTLGD